VREGQAARAVPAQVTKAWSLTRQRFHEELDRPFTVGGKNFKIPGGALAIVWNGRLQYAAGMGKLQHEGEVPFAPDSLITVASITKMITAATVMSLVEEGRIDLDKPVNGYLQRSGFKLQRRAEDQKLADTITMRHLLEHSSGLPDDLPSGVAEGGPVVCSRGSDAFKAYFQLHAQDPLWSQPGAVWNYSNTGYFAAAAVIEAVTGRSFEKEARERVLVPTGMTTASWDGDQARRKHSAADGYEYRSLAGMPPRLHSFTLSSTPCRVFTPAAGLKASVIDYAHFAEAFMAEDSRWLKGATRARFLTSQQHTYDLDRDYSYGFFIYPEYKGVKVLAHDGVAWGYRSVMLMIPSKKFAFIGFHNVGQSLPEKLWQQAFRAADLFLDLPQQTRERPAVSRTEPVKLTGEYRGWTYDQKNYSESRPRYRQLETRITFDDAARKLKWHDSRFGVAELVPTWEPAFNVSFPDARNNINVRFIRNEKGQVDYIVSRDYVARRVPEQQKLSLGKEKG
jgi:CubicO group peptidase (beta-lactamase class C family)